MASSLFLVTAVTAVRAETTLTYADLVHRVTDLSRLAVLPEKGEKCGMWSSYDRASRYDEKTGKYVAWDANGDGGGVIRSEGDHVVMAEMKGPGCIWRIWSAAAEKGHVKIYLDGQAQPAVDLPFADYFDGKHAPFAYPALSYNLGRSEAAARISICRFPTRNRARWWPTRAGAITSISTTPPTRQARSCPPSAPPWPRSTPHNSKR